MLIILLRRIINKIDRNYGEVMALWPKCRSGSENSLGNSPFPRL